MTSEQKRYIDICRNEPVKIGQWCGFDKLTDLHNEWLKSFIFNKKDETLQGHRSSYKTSTLSVAIALHIILFPDRNIIFLRKTDDDVVEIVSQVKKLLEGPVLQHLTQKIYGIDLRMLKSNQSEISTNLSTYARGAVQLLGLGIKGSLTGKHASWIITDDICNIKDRTSPAERKYTKQIYMELQNIKNRDGRITNTGTPWHKDDVFSIMPNISRFDCYSTGLMTKEQIEDVRSKMSPSLFAANYELKHIASEDAMFTTPPQFMSSDLSMEECDALLRDGYSHLDAAFGGADGSAFTSGNRKGNKLYVLGKLRKAHIDDCMDEFILLSKHFMCEPISCELNADKGYVGAQIRTKGGTSRTYHESTNKYIKISTYLKKWWDNIIFHPDTDPEYITEIQNYTIDAAHDDCPDSLASLARVFDPEGLGAVEKKPCPPDFDPYDWEDQED